MCVCERERERVCVCERERERESVCGDSLDLSAFVEVFGEIISFQLFEFSFFSCLNFLFIALLTSMWISILTDAEMFHK